MFYWVFFFIVSFFYCDLRKKRLEKIVEKKKKKQISSPQLLKNIPLSKFHSLPEAQKGHDLCSSGWEWGDGWWPLITHWKQQISGWISLFQEGFKSEE